MSALQASRWPPRRPWEWLPPYLQVADTTAGSVPPSARALPDVRESYASRDESAIALEAALRFVDAGGIARRLLEEIAPSYPIAVRELLLRRFWDIARPELEASAERRPMGFGEFIEHRMRALAKGSAKVSRCNRQLGPSHCGIAFDDGSLSDLAATAARVCTGVVRSGCDVGSRDVLAQAHAKLRSALVDLGDLRPYVTLQCAEECAGIYSDLAQLVSNARRTVRRRNVGRVTVLSLAYGACAALARSVGIDPPLPERGGVTLGGAVARLQDARWWRRQVRRVYGRHAENALRELGMVSRLAGLYVSDPTAERYSRQRARSAGYLRSMLLVNELGESIALEEAHNASVSNPKLRRTELMTRMAGVERYARENGHIVILANITLPGRFHRAYHESGDLNPRFDGSGVGAGAAQLQRSWASVRKALGRQGITIYGFRCSEPNHDGTVHWHAMVCCAPENAEEVRSTIRRYFRDELDPEEPGAEERRVVFIEVDEKRGSAVSYLAKYISKNIDGAGVGTDLLDGAGRDATETCERAVAHARTHGLRQFQPFGLPSVGVWRELRRLRVPPAAPGIAIFELWRVASEEGDFAAYVRLMGGVGGRSVRRPVSLYCERSRSASAYGDSPAPRVKGLLWGSVRVETRQHDWRLIASAPSAPTWTRGNNCPDTRTLVDIDMTASDSGGGGNPIGPPGLRG